MKVDRPIRIAVAGPGTPAESLLAIAEEVGRRIAAAGAVLICGGRTGVMEAAAKGAVQEGGLTVGLLPGAHAQEANPYIMLPLPTGMGEGRNVLVARTAEVLIAIGGEWGTLSEVALARKVAVPVILLRPDITAGLPLEEAADAADAVERALRLARESHTDETVSSTAGSP